MTPCTTRFWLVAVLSVCGVVARSGAAAPFEAAAVADEWPPLIPLLDWLGQQPTVGKVTRFDQPSLPSRLDAYRAVFMYVHKPLEPRVEKALIDYARDGGRLIVLHHGIASAKCRNSEWMRFVGVHIAPRNDPDRPWRVLGDVTHTLVNLAPGHYLTTHRITYTERVPYQPANRTGAAAAYPAIHFAGTEVFLNQQFTDGADKTVLFGSRCTDEQGAVIMQDRGGWFKAAGKGWLFYFQPGHRAADFEHPQYRRILMNCLSWTP